MAGPLGGYVSPAASPAVTAGSVVSGSLGAQSVVSGIVASGAVTGQAGGGYFTIASGTITTSDIGSGAIVSGLVASGQIGRFHIGSGQLAGFELGSGAIVSGRIASGQIGNFHVASGQIQGQAGSAVFNIASGTLSTYDHASGCTVARSQFVAPVYSGTSWTLLTEEIVSGVRAVCISQSGNIRVAMAAVSGRGPAVGVVIDNVLSGIQANVYTQGVVQFTSGLFTGISFFGQPVWLGRSGQLVPLSGSFGSGGYASGDEGQKLGVILALGSGGVLLNVNNTVWSGGPLGEATGGGIL